MLLACGYTEAQMISNPNTVYLLAGGTAGTKDGTGPDAQFWSPYYITYNVDGNIYTSEYNGNNIRKVSPTGVVTTFAGSGACGYLDAKGTAAQFCYPRGITHDPSGNLYVNDEGASVIRKITPSGVVTTVAGNTVCAYRDGPAASAQFCGLGAIAMDAAGNLFVSEG
jgi:streptogramin lyase